MFKFTSGPWPAVSKATPTVPVTAPIKRSFDADVLTYHEHEGKELRFTKHVVKGDGNCLLYCLLEGFKHPFFNKHGLAAMTTDKLRKHCIDLINKDADFQGIVQASFNKGQQTAKDRSTTLMFADWAAYAKAAAKPGFYLGVTEAQILAKVYLFNLKVNGPIHSMTISTYARHFYFQVFELTGTSLRKVLTDDGDRPSVMSINLLRSGAHFDFLKPEATD